ncbi:MYND-type domain-containing protein [Favolaschia claudopus]|uniref:MYND-type domain-containing protein n=1 Tax=Favolaschia claudopus TaxID=2862362 RepID=A0AAV9ZBW9_9AGAR
MAIPLPLPQDALNNPVRWNSEWERLLSGPYALPDGPSRCFDEALRDMGNVEISLGNYPFLSSSTCAVQRNLTDEALSHFSRDNFERKWMRASSDVRAQHILGAMGAVCSKARNLHDARAYCPEIRLLRLKLDGKVFLNLLKSLMLDDASFIPSEYKSVPNQSWDTWAAKQKEKNESEEEKLALADILLLRAKLISHVVHFTMRSFFGEEPPDLTVQRAIHKPKFSSEPPPEMVASLGYDAAKARMKEDIAGIKARHRQRPDICSYLGCVKPAPDPSVRFSRCPTCFDNMERPVRYCSQDCQRADWEGGHREVCGRSLDFDTVSQVVDHPVHSHASRPHIGLPVDGFKRSIPLVHQVTQLNLNPTVDYYLWSVDNEPKTFDFGPDTYPHFKFRELREGAMTTGDPLQVAVIAHSLCICFSSDGMQDKMGITPETIVAQMVREYGIETDDMKKQVLEMQMAQDYDPLHRPPLYWGAPLGVWENDNRVWNFSQTRVTFNSP